jgi:hypothetical protein
VKKLSVLTSRIRLLCFRRSLSVAAVALMGLTAACAWTGKNQVVVGGTKPEAVESVPLDTPRGITPLRAQSGAQSTGYWLAVKQADGSRSGRIGASFSTAI